MDAATAKRVKPPAWVLGALEFLQIGGVFYVLLLIPLIITWLASGTSAAPWQAAFTVAAGGWLLIQNVTLDIAGDPFGLTPWALTLIPVLMSLRAGRKLTDQLWADGTDEHDQRRLRPIHRAFLAGGIAYVVLSIIASWVTSAGDLHPLWWQAVLLPVLTVGIPALAGAQFRAYRLRKQWGANMPQDIEDKPLPAGFLVDFIVEQIARVLRLSEAAATWIPVVCQAAVIAFFGLLCGSGLLLAIAIIVHWTEISAIYEQLSPGVVGGSVLTVAQLGWLPNAVVFAAAWLSGAGFQVGAGNVFDLNGSSTAPLPDLPILGALPDTGGGWWWLVILIPIAAGALAGWYASTYESGPWWLPPLIGLAIGFASGVLWLVAAVLAGGAAGPGKFHEVGVQPWLFAGMTAAETAVGAIVVMSILAWTDRGVRLKTVSVT